MESAITGRSFKHRKAAVRAGLLAVSAATTGLVVNIAEGQTYAPIQLSSSSYNQDIVVEQAAPQTGATANITATMDYGTSNLAQNTWFEQGYDPANSSYGLPSAGTTFTSLNGSSHSFTMPSSYATNDALMLGYLGGAYTGTATVTTGTLKLSTPGSFDGLSFLTSASLGGGTQAFSATINYVNGSSQTYSGLYSSDWRYGGSAPVGAQPTTAAFNAGAYCTPSATGATTFTSSTSGVPVLYQVDLTGILDPIDPILSVTISVPSSNAGKIAFFAVSGNSSSTVLYTGSDSNTPATFDTTSQNFSMNGSPTSFSANQSVVFDDTAASNLTSISVTGTVSPLQLQFNNNINTYNFSNGMISIAQGATLNGTKPVTFNSNLTATTSINVTGSGPVTFNGYLNGATGVLITGNSGVTFAGLSNYTGATNVTSGSVTVPSVGSMGTGALYIGATGSVTLNNPVQKIASLNGAGSITINSNTSLTVNGSTGAIYSGVVSSSGTLTLNGPETFTNSSNNLNSNTLTNTGQLNLNGNAAVLTLTNAGALGAPYTLEFLGGGLTSSVPLTSATGNPISAYIQIASGSSAQLNGLNSIELAPSSGNEVELVGTSLAVVDTISVGTAGVVDTISGPLISDGATLNKNGSGTLYVTSTANNIYALNVSTGVLEFNAGTLSNASGGTPLLRLNGGTLMYGAGNTEDISSTHILSLNASSGINTNGNTIKFASPISSASTAFFNKSGAGSLTFQSSFSPAYMTVTGGTASSPSIVAFNGSGAVYIQSSTTSPLAIGENTGDFALLNISGGAHVSILGAVASGGTLNLGDQTNAVSSSGSTTDTGIINLSGSTSLLYSTSAVNIGRGNGATNYATGVINQLGGTFQASGANAIVTLGVNNLTSGTYNQAGGTVIAGSIVVGAATGSIGVYNLSGGTLNVTSITGGAGNSSLLFNGAINATAASAPLIGLVNNAQIFGSGLTITTNSIGTNTTTNSNETIAASLTSGVTGGADGGLIFNAGTGVLTLSGNNSYTGPTTVSGNLVFSQSGVTTLTGNVTTTASAGTMNQSGSGATLLSGNDSFPGGVYVSGGTLELLSGLVLNSGSAGITVSSNGSIGISSDTGLTTFNVHNSSGSGLVFDNYTSNMSFANYGILKLGGGVGSPASLAGSISGATTLVSIGPGTLILSGPNSYTGPTNLSGGFLSFASASNLPVGQVNFTGGGIQYASGVTTDLTSGGRTLFMTAAGGKIDTNSNNITFAGVITNASTGTFTKLGSGTFSLANATTFANLYVQGGTAAAPSVYALNGATNALTAATIGIGEAAGDNGMITVNNGAQLTATTALNVGDAVALGTGLAFNNATLNINDTGSFGTNVSTAVLNVGNGNGGTNVIGTINQNAGIFKATGTATFGNTGTGVYNMAGGTAVLSGSTYFGYGQGFNYAGIGIFNDTGGTTNISGSTYVGYNGSGGINVLGGRINLTSTLYLADSTLGTGQLNISSGTLNAASVDIGYAANAGLAPVVVNVTGGVFNSSGNVAIGYARSSTLNLTSGVFNASGTVYLSQSGTGETSTVNQTGGIFTAGTEYLGYVANATAVYNLSGGTATINTLTMAQTTTSKSTLNLNPGSTLIAGSVGNGAASYNVGSGAFFNFNGGTLQANSSSTAFISSGVTASIGSAGAIINTNGFSPTIAANLSTGVVGATDGGLTKTGLGVLTLTGTNNYTGITNINGGGVIALGVNPFGALGNTVNVNSGATIGLSSDTSLASLQSMYKININGGGYLFVNYNSNLNFTTPITLGAALGAPSSLLGNISGGGAFTYIGPGTLNLLGNDTIGSVNITAGILSIGSDAEISNVTPGFGATGVLQLNNYTSNLVFGGGTVNLGATGISTLTTALAPTTSLSFSGPGQLVLAPPSSTTGTTTITGGGTLNISSGSLGTSNVNLSNGTIVYGAGATDDLTASRTFLLSGPGTINTNGNNITYSGNVTGAYLGAFTKTGSGNLTFGGSLTPTSANISGGTPTAPSMVTFSGSSANYNQSATSSFLVVGLNTNDYAVLNISGGATVTSPGGVTLGYQASSPSTSGSNIDTGIINLLANSSLINPGSAAVVYLGRNYLTSSYESYGVFNQIGGTFIGGSATTDFYIGYNFNCVGVYNLSGGTATVSAIKIGNSASSSGMPAAVGTLNLNGGTLIATAITGGSGSSYLNFNGGTLMANASSATFITALSSVQIETGPAIINTNGFSDTIVSAITSGASPDGGLVKLGTGTLTLSATNTYNGGTNVGGGTLSIASGANVGSGPITLSGGTLALPATAPTLSNSILLSPSTTSGLLTTISTGHTTLTVGTISFGANSTLNLTASGTVTPGYTVTTGAIYLSGTDTLDIANTSNGLPGVAMLGALNDNGTAATFAVRDAGSVTLTAAATSLVNGTQIDVGVGALPGTLNLATSGALGTLASVDVTSGSTLNLSAGQPQTLGMITDSGKIILNGNTVTVGNTNSLTGRFSGVISDGSASGSLTVGGGASLTLAGADTYTGLTTVNSGATLTLAGTLPGTNAITSSGTFIFGANNTSGGVYSRASGPLTIASGGLIKIAAASPQTTRTLLTPASLSIAGGSSAWTGTLDLTNNELVIPGASLAQLTNQVQSGFANGTWTGTGITSSAAANDSTHLTAVGVILNSTDGGTTALYGSTRPAGTFDGSSPGATAVLVKYTYYGDTNLDGAVDGSDYSRIDASFLSEQSGPAISGWYNGDFNYDGVVDGSDYTLIDNAFNTQGSTLGTNPLAQIAAQVGGVSAVPEPASMSMFAIGATALLGRRRRRGC